MRYGEGHARKTRAAIIDVAARMVRESGFTQASVPGVMRAAGLTHGGFYAHFPDKTALLTAAVAEAFVESPKNFAFLADLANKHGDAGLIARHYLAEHRVTTVDTGCPAAALLGEVARQGAPVRDAFQDGVEATRAALAVTDGIGENASWSALAMLVGTLALMRACPDASVRDAMRGQAEAALRRMAGQA